MEFQELRNILKENVPIDIETILNRCGFDTELSFLSITSDTLIEIEEYINEDRSFLQGTSYHKIFLLNLPDQIKRCGGFHCHLSFRTRACVFIRRIRKHSQCSIRNQCEHSCYTWKNLSARWHSNATANVYIGFLWSIANVWFKYEKIVNE